MNNKLQGLLAAAAAVLICVGVVLVLGLVLMILFCVTLQRTQTEVRPRNRQIPPGLVWLHLIHLGSIIPLVGPLIGLGGSVWDLIMVLKLSGSLQREFEDRGEPSGGGYGKAVGLIWAGSGMVTGVLGIAYAIIEQVGGINPVGNEPVVIGIGLLFLALWLTGLVCWIIYWVQMAGYGRQLRERRREYATGSIEEDFDDEMRGPRRGRDRDFDDLDEEDDRRSRRRRYDEDDDFDDRRGRRRREPRHDDEPDDPGPPGK
jgi:hypothetical protein